MFRKTSNQKSLFEIDSIYPGVLPGNDWSYIYQDKVLPKINENKFAHLFEKEGGAPNKSIRTMVSILIFMGLEKLTWRGAEFQFSRRLDWLIATNTPLGEDGIDHTTLFKFFNRLEHDTTAQQLFQELTGDFIQACGTKIKKQRTDSFFIHGWLKTLSRYGLFKETIRVFLNELKNKKPGLYDNISPELSRVYLEKQFDLTEKDKEKAQREIKDMAEDLYLLKEHFKDHPQVIHYKSYQTLGKVFEQQCEVLEANADKGQDTIKITIRETPKGDNIISTPHNTDARYTKKREQKICGDRAFSTETCDENNKTQFITDVGLTDSNTPDVEELGKIQERLDDAGSKPEKQYADAGFVNGKTILSSNENGISLEGPSSGKSQSFEAYNDKDRPLDIGDFDVTIKSEDNELDIKKCPNNKQPIDQGRSPKTGKQIVHFDAKSCNTCGLKDRCPAKIGKHRATVTFDQASYVGASRHHKYMNSKEYRKECGIRAGAEALVSELVRAHGVRKSKHRCQAKTKLQLIFAAIACNVKRYINHWDQYACPEAIVVASG